jgi:hypothetical protein
MTVERDLSQPSKNGFEAIRPKRSTATPVFETGPPETQVQQSKELGKSPTALVPSVVPTLEKVPSPTPAGSINGSVIDPDLTRVVCAWGVLPKHVKLAILALALVEQE